MRRCLSVINFGKKHIDDGYLHWIVDKFPESDSWCIAVSALTRNGKRKQKISHKINVRDLLSELKYCTTRRDLQKGRELHTNAVKAGTDSNIYVAAALINMYSKCGSMQDARTLFDSIQEPDVVCWNALILGYAGNGQGSVALGLLTKMKEEGRCAPDSVTHLAALKSCTLLADGSESGKRECLERGRQIQLEIGHNMDHFSQSTLIKLYGKCGSMEDARTVFDSIQEPDVVSWTAIILGYAENGEGSIALDLFSRMKDEGRCAPNSVTYLAALKACTLIAADGGESGKREFLGKGRKIHSEIGHHMSHHLQSALINLYGKCGSMEDARKVFDDIQEPDMVLWNALILGYAENGQGSVALDLFSRMKEHGRCTPDSVTYLAALKACMLLAANGDKTERRKCLEKGRQLHLEIGLHMDNFVHNALISLYGKCESMEEARTVFDSIQEPNVVCWNALILGYAENGQASVALDLFSGMKGKCTPNSVTYLAALKACTLLAADGDEAERRDCLERVRQLHSEIGCCKNQFVQSMLIKLYGKCGSMQDARTVFDSIQEPDMVCRNALILAYVDNGQASVAFDLFSRMKGCSPDSVTYVAALKACTLIAADGGEAERRLCLKRGRHIHSEIGQHMDQLTKSTIIKLYGKCSSMEDARAVFDSIQDPDVVSWTAIILGYADNGQGLVALDLFSRMKDGRCTPDSFTYVAVLKACCSVGALAIGRRIHSMIRDFDAHVVTCLIDFYAKCGNMEEAREVFDLYPQARGVSTWTALLAGYAQFGDTDSVFSLFEAMQDQGCQPNAVTFVCMLSCCSHAGLLEKAREYLEAMPKRYEVTPTVMHYSCMIDLLGRANKLHEAVAFLQKMPCDPDAVTWSALLSACRKWQNAEIGSWAFKSLMDLDRKNASAYVLMAEIYESRNMSEEQEWVLEARQKFDSCKLSGQSYVMDDLGRMAKFGEEDVQDKDKQFLKSMKEQGYVAGSYTSKIHDVTNENALCGHSERRAVFYGILNTPPDEVIRVVKNMRMCNECHSVTKMISKITRRVIMIRDESRFHVMENGICARRDYF